MMARRLGSTPFRELLASSIASDDTIRNCADALDGVLASATRAIPNILVHARLARDGGFGDPVPMLAPLTRLADRAGGLAALPGEILDLLAWQFHVEDYDTAISIEARREMIFSSILLHRRRGTPWAVRHALATALRIPARIEQWFEYGGEPYYFRVQLGTASIFANPEWLKSAFQIIMDYKNVRSWLEQIRTFQEIRLDVYRFAGVISQATSIKQTLFFLPAKDPELWQRAHPAVISFTAERQVLRIPEAVAPMLQVRIDPAVSTSTASRERVFFPAPMPLFTRGYAFGQRSWTYSRVRLAN